MRTPNPAAPRLDRRTHRRGTRRLVGLVGAALVTAGLPALGASPAEAIVGGTNVFAGDYRYVAQVNNTAMGGQCTGALVHPSWVLTAVHCSVPGSTGDMTVRVDNTTVNTGGQMRRVTRILTNPSYAGGHNDVALLELSSPITDVPVVRLGTPAEGYAWDGVQGGPFSTKDQADSIGWGRTNAAGTASTTTLRVRGVFVSPQLRDGANIPYIPVSGGPCLGDSGGPLLSTTNTGETVVSGVLKAAACGSSGSYSMVGSGPNRDWLLSVLPVTPFSPYGTKDWDRDGHQDIVTRNNANGDLLLYPGRSVRGYSGVAPVRIGNGWNGTTAYGMTDYDRDGHQDIITRRDSTGELFLYPGQSVRGYSQIQPIRVGTGFAERTPFGAVDWDKNGTQDLVARDDVTGDLFLYPGPGARSALTVARVKIGNGWNNASPFGLSDWDRDTHQDIVSRDNTTGDLFLYRGQSVRGYSTYGRTKIGNGWAGTTWFGTTDWERDGHQDIITRIDATRDLWLYPGQSVRGYSQTPPVKIGNGW